MIDKRVISDPKTRYGHGSTGTKAFITQRITGALNVLFLLFFVWFVISVADAGRAGMVDNIRNPFVGIVLALLVLNVCAHMRIGVREVIEDYMDEGRTNRLSMLLNDMFCLFVAVIGVGSIVKIMFWG